MTDEEKVAAIEALCESPRCAASPATLTPRETIERAKEIATCILALLAEPTPTVEWMSSYPSRWDAHIGQWSFGISRKDGLFSAWVEHYTESTYAESGKLLTLDAAKRRAVALYAALRGVT